MAQVLGHWSKSEAFTFSFGDFVRFMLLNIIVAPPNFIWQGWLEKTFPARKIVSENRRPSPEQIELGEANGFKEKQEEQEVRVDFSWTNTFKKWFVDCITMGAIMNTVAFLIIMGLMKSKTLPEIGQAVRKETIPIIVAGYKIWPIASIISFTFIPVEKRIVFLSFAGFLWGIYMSLVAARQ
ncbi:Mpv17 / PMP22-like protein 2 [Elsinoe fawcettii]|nr:Mpv17 / PMP22-like protein 2 [Elsinoe fawcettii]